MGYSNRKWLTTSATPLKFRHTPWVMKFPPSSLPCHSSLLGTILCRIIRHLVDTQVPDALPLSTAWPCNWIQILIKTVLIRIRSLPCDGSLVHVIYWTNCTLLNTLSTVSWVCSWQRVLECIKQFHQTITVPSFLSFYVSARWCSPDFAMILIKPDLRLVVHRFPWESVTLTLHQWSFHDLDQLTFSDTCIPRREPFYLIWRWHVCFLNISDVLKCNFHNSLYIQPGFVNNTP